MSQNPKRAPISFKPNEALCKTRSDTELVYWIHNNIVIKKLIIKTNKRESFISLCSPCISRYYIRKIEEEAGLRKENKGHTRHRELLLKARERGVLVLFSNNGRILIGGQSFQYQSKKSDDELRKWLLTLGFNFQE
jgi:hypothetical protein